MALGRLVLGSGLSGGLGAGRDLVQYAYMHKANPNIFRYFISFYSCFVRTSFLFFSENFPIFVATLFTSKACLTQHS